MGASKGSTPSTVAASAANVSLAADGAAPGVVRDIGEAVGNGGLTWGCLVAAVRPPPLPPPAAPYPPSPPRFFPDLDFVNHARENALAGHPIPRGGGGAHCVADLCLFPCLFMCLVLARGVVPTHQ